MLVKREDVSASSGGVHQGVVVAASVLSADFTNLGRSIAEVASAGADWLHIDVMDGCFVPNITMGPVVISSIRKCTNMLLDVHLMVQSPTNHLGAVINAGADLVTVHIESEVNLHRLVREIKSYKKKVGIALVPKTHHSVVEYIIHELDLVLVMSVDPGFGGQEFLTSQLKKVEKIREMIEKYSLCTKIAVDGGITAENAAALVGAGADILVIGSSLFSSPNMGDTVRRLKSLREW